MKAISVNPQRRCVLETFPQLFPGEGQVIIKVVCAPVHILDIQCMRDGFSSISRIPGFEGAGIVIRTGSGFKTHKLLNKKVCFFVKPTKLGSWSEFVLCDISDCCIIKEEFGFIKASTLMLLPLTILMISKIIKKKKYTSIINTLPASSLGKILQRWCNYKNVSCINIVRSESQAKDLLQIGAKYVINSSSQDYLIELFTITDKLKPRCCFDGVGGIIGRMALGSLDDNGVVYVYSALSESSCLEMQACEIFYRNKRVKGLWMPGWYEKLTERKKQNLFNKVQKKQYIYRVDNVIVKPVMDVLDEINEYFTEYPKQKIIMDFSELSHNTQSIFSPVPSPRHAPAPVFDTTPPESDDSLTDLAELPTSYVSPRVLALMEKLPHIDNLPEDSVYIQLTESSIYYGGLKLKRPEGYCYIYYSSGEAYQGYFEHGKRTGKGRYIYDTGDYFEGSWKGDIQAGAGVFNYQDGRKIQGNFLQNEVIGTGIELTPDGEKYEGSFFNKKRHGKGILTTKVLEFEGKFRAGEPFGYGVVKYNDGKEFVGEFSGNSGVGLLKYPDLTYFEGCIVDFTEEGEGEVVNSEGIRKKGVWEKGKLKYYIEAENIEIVRVEKAEEEYEGTPVEVMSSEDLVGTLIIK